MKNKSLKGISLMVLVITVIVIIIVAGAVILNLTKNNPIENAKEAAFKSDLDSFKNELLTYESSLISNSVGEFDVTKLQADSTSVTYNGDGMLDSSVKTIVDIITSLKGKNLNDFAIVDGKLVYKGTNEGKKDWSKDMNVELYNDGTNVTIATTTILPIANGTSVIYKIRVYSNVGIKETSDLTDKVVLVDVNGNELAIQPVMTLSSITNVEDGKEFTATITTDQMSLGEYNLKLKASTFENNLGTLNGDTLSINSFIIDTAVPLNPTITPSTTNWTKYNITATISYPSFAEVKEYSLDGANWIAYSGIVTISDNTTIYARASHTDSTVIGQSTLTVANIDRTNPVVSFVPNGGISRLITTVVQVTDIGGSGSDGEVGWKIDTQNEVAPNFAMYYPLDGTGKVAFNNGPVSEGNNYLWIQAKDKVENTNVVVSQPFIIDTKAPTVMFGTNGGSNIQTASTTVTLTDVGAAGVKTDSLQYIWATQNTTAPSSGWAAFSNGTTINKSNVTTTYYLWVKGEDNLGNYTTSVSNGFSIDNTAPAAPTFSPSTTAWTNSNVTVTITYPADAATKQYSYDTATWYNYTTALSISSNCTIYSRAIDAAGNQSSQSTLGITNIDKALPTATISNLASNVMTLTATVTLTDGSSGISLANSKYIVNTTSTTYGTTNSIWTSATSFILATQNISASNLADGNYYVHVLSKDNAGNSVERVSTVVTISTGVVTLNGLKFNRPDLSKLPSSTVACYWDSAYSGYEMALSTASTSTSWYDYANKKWANIKTSNNGNSAYWVWIPRYAYKIPTANVHTTTPATIDIKFLAGTSNTPADGTTLPSDYIVHPAFTFGGVELPGIWVAKYEASSSQQGSMTSGGSTGYLGGGDNSSLQVRVVPLVYSWRKVSVVTSQIVCMNMTSASGSLGTTTNIDTHLIKNSEWGATAYLSLSAYGSQPWSNPYGDLTSGSYKFKTGCSGPSKDSASLAEGNANLYPYCTSTGEKASTTGNIYGVFDMSGGSWESTASLINNGNWTIGTYGGTTFTSGNKILPAYEKYFDIYEPGDYEKEGGTYYGSATLWNLSNTDANNVIRKNVTAANYAKLSLKKGDAIYETSSTASYFGKYTSGTGAYDWLISTTRDSSSYWQPSYGWNSDLMLCGSSYLTWFDRGGTFCDGIGAGVIASSNYFGDPLVNNSFRPVLITGTGL